jgi:DNA-binding NtrC family response regulator
MNERQIRIFIVDDDEDDILLVKDYLREGMKDVPICVDHAPSLSEALFRMKQTLYDVGLFDYRVGKLDGLSLLRLVRANGIDTPVIFLTGQGSEEIAVEAMKAGATDYLIKSRLSADVLCTAIQHAIKSHKHEKASP